MTTIPDIKSTYKTWFTWASLTPAQQAFATSQGYSSGSVSVAIGDVVDYVTQTVASTQTLLIDANGDPICNYGFNGVANVTFPAALAHTLTGTVDTANKTLVNNISLLVNAYAAPLTLTNTTGEKRLYAITAILSQVIFINSGVVADTALTARVTSTVPFIDGTVSSLIGMDNSVREAPTFTNGDRDVFSGTVYVSLNSGQSTSINMTGAFEYVVITGSTANTVASIGAGSGFQIISVPQE